MMPMRPVAGTCWRFWTCWPCRKARPGAAMTATTSSSAVRPSPATRRTQEQRFADAVAKAKQFDEFADKEKSELQKAVEAREQMEQELATERASRLRLEVAQAMGLPTEMAARLQGGTKEELEADANALARLLPRQQAPNGFRDAQGKPGDAPTGDWLRQQISRR